MSSGRSEGKRCEQCDKQHREWARMAKVPEGPDLDVLLTEIQRLRDAGNALCERAIYVGTHYDGIHRLLEAAATWLHTLATDFGRAP